MMNKKFKLKPAHIFFSLLIFFALFKIWDFSTAGFAIFKIRSSVPYKEKWNVSSYTKEEQDLNQIFKQPFHYLGKGCQCFAFASADDKYVIKFFKHYKWRFPKWMEHLPPFLARFRIFNWSRKSKNQQDVFDSCVVAYTKFKNETGTLYLHLQKTMHLPNQLTLINRMGKKIIIDPNDFEFVFQRKAEQTQKRLIRYKKEKLHDASKECIRNLLKLVVHRRKVGYSDKDPNIVKNFGFVENIPIELDIGGFYSDPNKGLNYFYTKEMKKVKYKLMLWIKRFYPELESFAKEEIASICDKRELIAESSEPKF